MPSLSIITPIIPGNCYHIYNRGNNKERIFHNKEHYQYFMKKYLEIIHPHVDTFAYCLLPNHFHFLLRIKEGYSDPCGFAPSHQFRKFFQAYATWFNKKEERRGSLFTKYYRRIKIDDQKHLLRLVRYIHHNPKKHGIEIHFSDYQYCSFVHYIEKNASWLAKDEVLEWFENDYRIFFRYHMAEEILDEFGEILIDE